MNLSTFKREPYVMSWCEFRSGVDDRHVAGRKMEGLCTLKLPREAYFELILQVGFQSLKEELFTFSSSSKVKN